MYCWGRRCAGVNTNLIFFQKGNPTKEIWYYELPLPEGLKQYTKGRPIRDEEFASARRSLGVGGTSIKGRKASKNMWKVSIKEIQEKNYNLDFKNPNKKDSEIQKSPKELLREIEEREEKISKILDEIKKRI